MRCIGVDIGGTKCIVTLAEWLNEGLQFIESRQFETRVVQGPESILQDIETIVDELIHSSKSPVISLGISCGGPLDSTKGIILSPPNLPGWNEIEIVNRLSSKFGIPTYLENDANAGALAEWKFGAGTGTNDMVFLTFGTGLGAGLILGGKLYRGLKGLAGELGHWRLSEAAGPKNYDKSGSFQGFCSGNGMTQWYQYFTGETRTAEQLAELARRGDSVAQDIYRQAGTVLGKGLALLIDLLAPEVIAIGGIFGYAHDLLWSYAEESLKNEVLPALLDSCRIVPAALGRGISNYASCIVAVHGCASEMLHKHA